MSRLRLRRRRIDGHIDGRKSWGYWRKLSDGDWGWLLVLGHVQRDADSREFPIQRADSAADDYKTSGSSRTTSRKTKEAKSRQYSTYPG